MKRFKLGRFTFWWYGVNTNPEDPRVCEVFWYRKSLAKKGRR